MSECTYHATVSLDGFLADPEHSLAWLAALPRSAARAQWSEEARAETGAVVMGGRTYRRLLAHSGVRDTAGWLSHQGTLPHFVLTGSDVWLPPGAPVHRIGGDVTGWWPNVQHAAGAGAIGLVGGGRLAAQVAAAGLLDRIRLSLAPVVLGAGVPVLPTALALSLELQQVRDDGAFVQLDYRVGPMGRGRGSPAAPDAAEDRVPAEDLVEFLLGRIGEDERAAAAATGSRWVPAVARDPDAASWTDVSAWLVTLPSPGPGTGPTVASVHEVGDQQHLVRWDPARILADCAVRRRLVQRFAEREPQVLAELASTWAAHPDHRQEWAPTP